MKTQKSMFTLPAHLSPSAAALFEQIRTERSLCLETSLQRLLQAVELFDRAEACRAKIEAEGVMVLDRFKQSKPHPLIIPERASRAQFVKLVESLPWNDSYRSKPTH
jgi:hypothetical protein